MPSIHRRARSDARGAGPRLARGFQIGPKIRIGGTIGKIGQNVKIAAGKALSNPIVDGALTLIPGVGPGLAAAAGAAGKVLDTSNGGLHGVQGVMDVAKGAAAGYGAGKLAVGLKSGIGSTISGLMSGKNPDGSPMSVLDRLKGLVAGGGADGQGSLGTLGDIAGKIGGVAGAAGGGGGGGGSLLDTGLLAASVASNAQQRAKANSLRDSGVDYLKSGYDERAPLRTRAMSMLQDTSTPDLSSIFKNDGNVYDQQRRGTLAPQAPSAASQMTGGQALSNTLSSRALATPR